MNRKYSSMASDGELVVIDAGMGDAHFEVHSEDGHVILVKQQVGDLLDQLTAIYNEED